MRFFTFKSSFLLIFGFVVEGGSGIQCCSQDGSQTLPPQQRHPQCMPIEIPFNDNFYAQFGQGCMNFVRTMPAVAHNCSLGAINQVSAICLGRGQRVNSIELIYFISLKLVRKTVGVKC
jgi:Animal haem peroxidase